MRYITVKIGATRVEKIAELYTARKFKDVFQH